MDNQKLPDKIICVFCSSSEKVDQKYLNMAYDLGKMLSKEGFGLLWGGCNIGLMNEIARGVKESMNSNYKYIIGVILKDFIERGLDFKDCNELIVVENLNERKEIMVLKSDAFIVLPGGFGTLDEFFDTLAKKLIGIHNKPIIILNFENYFGKLFEFFENIYCKGFADIYVKEYYNIVDSIDNLIKILKSKLNN